MAKAPAKSQNRPAAVPREPVMPRLAALSHDIRTLLINVSVILLVVGLVPMIGGQFLRSDVLIEPISIPASLVETGLTPEVAANRLWDGLKQVKDEAGSAKGAISAVPDTQKVDFSIPDAGLSIDSLIYYVRQFFHVYETRISGDFRCADPACTPDGITLRLRVSRNDLTVIDLPPRQALTENQYFREAASDIMAVLDPFTALAADASTQPVKAMALARRLIRSGHVDAKWAHNLLGNLLLDQGDTDAAIAAYRAAIALDGGFIPALANLGNSLRITGDVQGSREAFDRVEAADRGNPLSQAGYADLALLEGKTSDATKFLLAANTRSPLDPRYIIKAGIIESNAGRYEQAIVYWRQALEMDPANDMALALIGQQMLTNSQYAEIEKVYRDAADFAPGNPVLQGQHAEFLLLVKNYPEALRRADIAIGLGPNEAAYRISRASALQYLERYQEALDELDRAALLDPDNAKIPYEQATNLKILGRDAEAIKAYRRFLSLDPDSLFAPVVEMWIAELEAKLDPNPAQGVGG